MYFLDVSEGRRTGGGGRREGREEGRSGRSGREKGRGRMMMKGDDEGVEDDCRLEVADDKIDNPSPTVSPTPTSSSGSQAWCNSHTCIYPSESQVNVIVIDKGRYAQ